MNLCLHGIGGDECPIEVADSLAAKPPERYDLVLTNPPFGKKSSMSVVNEEGEEDKSSLIIVRDDFWATTSNKQLNFVQHVKSLLKIQGRAAIVVPNTFFSKVALGRPFAESSFMSATCTHSRRLLRAGREGECPVF